jgi:regulatory protein
MRDAARKSAEQAAPDPLELAYRYLNRRERTVAEVTAHLEGRGCEDVAVTEAVEELQQLGVLDDERYARLFVEDRRALDAWGNERIERALLGRGIERELIAHALSSSEGEDELGRAVELLRRRFPEPPQDRRSRDRALGVLARKGYDSELAVDALAAYARGAGRTGFR